MKKINQRKSFSQTLLILLIASLFIIPGSATVFNGLQKNIEQTTTKGTTIYVDDTNTAGPWDGSIDHPYRFIQDGIDHAVAGDAIFVFNGNYVENVVVSKSLTLIGEDSDLTKITGDDFGTVLKIIEDGVIIYGFTITQCGSNSNNAGIMIHTSNNIIVNNNIQHNNCYGILILEGHNNIIYHNNIIENTFQAFDAIENNTWDNGYPVGGNYWDDYTGTDADEDGIGDTPYPTGYYTADQYPLIHPYGSVYNDDTNEIFLSIQAAITDADTQNGHTIIVREGIYFEHLTLSKSIFLYGFPNDECIIDGRSLGDVLTICADNVHIELFRIQHSGSGEQNAGVIVNGNNCSLKRTIIHQNFQGIVLKQSTENTQIAYNEIVDNGWNGITLNPGCKGIHIFENTLRDNFYAGIGINDASNNYIYHNNFKSNRHQAYDNAANIWDDGYPSAGNYWDDYTGSDNDGDGIGDIPYAIPDGINTDKYPLMAPYTGGDTIPPVVKIQTPSNGLYLWGLRLLSGLFRKSTVIYGPITIEVEATDAQSDISHVEFLIDDSLNPVSTDDQAPYSWKWSQPYLLMRKHTIIVIAYDNAGNTNFDQLDVRKYF